MEKQKLLQLINDGNSLNTISKLTGKCLSTVRYWVDKHELKSRFTPFKKVNYGEFRFCPKCEKNHPIKQFYQKRGKPNSSSYCKDCTRLQTLERVRDFKIKMIEYKGGKCERCDYNKYIGALEFHHLDPTKKDFNLSSVKTKSFDDTIKKELDKCILVCSNCHKEIHSLLWSQQESNLY